MNLKRWQDLREEIKSNFKVEDEGRLIDNEHGETVTDYLIFKSPVGRMKLEFITKAKIVDKKLSYSNRIGSDVMIEYIYSPTEKTYQFLAYRWDEAAETWLPIDPNQINFS